MIQRNKLRRKNYFAEEDVSPMEGAINIVDAMLVFACGLILSLVVFWNVDLNASNPVSVERSSDLKKTEEIQDAANEKSTGGKEYEKMGTVYKDPATGELYMLEDE
jgi:hypothetical protein